MQGHESLRCTWTHNHVLPDAGQVGLDVDAHLAELIPGAEAAQLHDLRRVDGARTHDHLSIDRQLSCAFTPTRIQTLVRP